MRMLVVLRKLQCQLQTPPSPSDAHFLQLWVLLHGVGRLPLLTHQIHALPVFGSFAGGLMKQFTDAVVLPLTGFPNTASPNEKDRIANM